MISFFHRTTRNDSIASIIFFMSHKNDNECSPFFSIPLNPLHFVWKDIRGFRFFEKYPRLLFLIFFFHLHWEIQNTKTMIITFSFYLKKPNV